MRTHHYLYIIPTYYGIVSENELEQRKWMRVYEENIHYSEQCIRYSYQKEINENGCAYRLFFINYASLNTISFVINPIDTNQEASENDIAKLFEKYVKECGVRTVLSRTLFILRCCDDKDESCNNKHDFSCIYYESHLKDKLIREDDIHFDLKLFFDSKLTKIIINNIFDLLALSEIAHYLSIKFLDKDTSINGINKKDLIKSLWYFKFTLCRCPASQVFPVFFTYRISLIDNLLGYRYYDHIDALGSAIKAQKILLAGIHHADKGIYGLTIIIALEVVSRVTEHFGNNFEYFFGIDRMYLFIISSIITLVIIYFYNKQNMNNRYMENNKEI